MEAIQSTHLWEKLTNELATQQQFMEMFTRSLTADYRSRGGGIFCARGCSGCCTLVVNCTLTEAVTIAIALDEERSARVDSYVARLRELLASAGDLKEYLRLHRRETGGCPLLERDGSCGIYSARPLSCRALLATRESRWCSADFAMLSPEDKRAFMESLDRDAVAFPMHYLAASKDAGTGLENRLAIRLAETFGFSVYGNMPVLVHLVKRHDLARVVPAGRGAVADLLVRVGLDNPLLLQLEGV